METDHVFHQRGTWLYPATGKAIELPRLIENLSQKAVVLMGETHDIPEIHRWQLHLITFLYTQRQDIMVGFEMFPRRCQPVLDEWVEGKLTTEQFIEKSEWYQVWGFPAEIYLPIFHFCRQYRVRMLALNCYRELVTRVGKEGWDAVPIEERDGLTPAASPLPGYWEHIQAMTQGMGMRRNSFDAKQKLAREPLAAKKTAFLPRSSMDSARFLRAMQTWDRAFACNIYHAYETWQQKNKKAPLIVGILGRGHLEYGFGTPYQLFDLGIKNSAVLLPSMNENWTLMPNILAGNGLPERPYADAIFRLDMPEARAIRKNMPKNALSEAIEHKKK